MRLGIRSVLPAALSVISPDETYRRPRCTPGHLSAFGKCTVSYHRFHSASTAASTSAVTISRHSGNSDIAFSWRNGSCAHHDTTPTPVDDAIALHGATTLADQPVGPVSTIERISPTVLPARPSCARFRPSERKSRRSIVEVSVMRPSMTGVATPATRPSSDMATSPHGTSSITYLCWSEGGVGVHW